MDGDHAGGELLASSASPRTEEAIAAAQDDAHLPPTPSDGDYYDDLYGDVNVGFIPLLPLSPSSAPTSPPKTPSPGRSVEFPRQSPHRLPPPEPLPAPAPHREPEPQQKPDTPRHQPPPPLPPVPRHQMAPPQPQPQPQCPPRGGGASYSSPPRCTSLYISELHWWTTDAEVEAALAPAPHDAAAALYGLYFYADKFIGKSRGICRADFLNPDAAASAATVLHGHAFHGRHCVASLARPPALHRLGDDSDSYAEAARSPNPAGGLGNGGRGASDAAAVRGNVAPALGDRPPLAPPQLPVVARPSPSQPFPGILGGVGGYGGFQSMGQYNAGMGNGMMSSALAHHMNPPFLAASGMAMQGSGAWYGQGMSGGLWGAQQDWYFRSCQMPWQQLRAPRQHQQAHQQFGNGNYGKQGRGSRRDRPSNKNEERSIGNVRYLNRRQADRDGGDYYKEKDCEKGSHQERIVDKEREQEKHWNQRDRHGGDNRRHQEYTERADFGRRVRARSRSRSRDDGDDDNPRRRR